MPADTWSCDASQYKIRPFRKAASNYFQFHGAVWPYFDGRMTLPCLTWNFISGSPRSDLYALMGKYIPIHFQCIGMYPVCIFIQNPKSVLTIHVLSINSYLGLQYRLNTHQYNKCLLKYKPKTYSQYPNTNQAPFNTDKYTSIRTNTSQYIVNELVCILAVLKYIQSVLKYKSGPIQYWRKHINTHKYQPMHRAWIGLYCLYIHTVSIQIQIRLRSILTNTHQSPLYSGFVCICLYWACICIYFACVKQKYRPILIDTYFPSSINAIQKKYRRNPSWMDWYVLISIGYKYMHYNHSK